MRSVYPQLLKFGNHDFLHYVFLRASSRDLLPSVGPISTKIGIDSDFDRQGGMSVDGLFALGASFVELGPTTVDPQHQPALKTQIVRVNGDKVEKLYSGATYSCNQIINGLILRQEALRDAV